MHAAVLRRSELSMHVNIPLFVEPVCAGFPLPPAQNYIEPSLDLINLTYK